MAISVSYTVAGTVTSFVSCRPFNYIFHRWQAEYSGICIDFHREIFAAAVINIVLDGAITLLPATQMQV